MMTSNDHDRNPPEIQTLHDFLNKHPMYQHQLAQLLGVTTSSVEKWSSGSRSLTPRTKLQLNTLHERLNQNPEIREKYVKTSLSGFGSSQSTQSAKTPTASQCAVC